MVYILLSNNIATGYNTSDELVLSDDLEVQPTKTTRRPVCAVAKRAAERFKHWSAWILEDAVDS